MDLNISIVSVGLLFLGFLAGFVIARILTNNKLSSNYSVMKSDSEHISTQNDRLSSTVSKLEAEILELSNKLKESQIQASKLENELLKTEGLRIRDIEVERREARQLGEKDALKDYAILYQPFVDTNNGFFNKKTITGYRYQLFIKGAPAFEPKDVITFNENIFDEEVKRKALDAMEVAIAAAAKACGMPTVTLPSISHKPIKKDLAVPESTTTKPSHVADKVEAVK